VIMADSRVLYESSFTLNEPIRKIQKNDLQNKTLEEIEKEMIMANIHKEKGNMSSVARNLGVTRQTLYNKMKKYHL